MRTLADSGDAAASGASIWRRSAARLAQTTLRQLGIAENPLCWREETLAQDGLIRGEWQIPASGPAKKVYVMTETGRAELATRTAEWQKYARIMQSVLGRAGDALT